MSAARPPRRSSTSRRAPAHFRALRRGLDALADGFDPSRALERDPLGIVRAMPAPEREVVAHIAAPLAYGSVALIRRAIGEVLEVLGDAPADAVRDHRFGDFCARRPDFVYRMTRAEDVDGYLSALGALLREHGTLEQAFAAGREADDVDAHAPLGRYVARIREAAPNAERRGLRYLTPDPRTGSAAKRWHLMLRWLCRPDDGADLGAWQVLPPSALVLPLDTHTSRLAGWLGLSARKTADYKLAREATDALLRCAPSDPLRYDMPLCYLGVAGDCRHRFEVEVCSSCDLRGVCRWTRGRRWETGGAA